MYDAIVLGLGGMGSATLAHAARRGLRVLGLEQFARGHDRGSSSGRSRIVRKAYFESPAYVPLLQRSFELWHALERDTGLDLLRLTGVLLVGARSAAMFENARTSARVHGISIEELDANAIVRRFPCFAPRPDEIGIFEPDAGLVVPELAIEAHLRVAEAAHAELRFGVKVTAWHGNARGMLDIVLDDGTTLETRRLAICLGAWFESVAADLGIPLVVERRVQHWFAPERPGFGPADMPTFLIAREDQPSLMYGFPDLGDGVKAAFHGLGAATHADGLDRIVHANDTAPLRAALAAWLPGAAGRYLGGKVCMYALTPDEHFVLGQHPADPRIALAGGFSGHGFKFAPVIGEIVAGFLSGGGTEHDIGFLSPTRFASETFVAHAG